MVIAAHRPRGTYSDCGSGSRATATTIKIASSLIMNCPIIHVRVAVHRSRKGLKRDHSEFNSRMKGPESTSRVSLTFLVGLAGRDDHLTA
jgi:hypothetical protein